jgi:hypothetical protein
MADTEFTAEEIVSETWRPVIGAEETYAVSSIGRVMRTSGRTKGRVLAFGMDRKGYRAVYLYSSGRIKARRVHTLVFWAFVGPLPHGHEINHIDGVKLNNRPQNLEAVSHTDNMRHASRIGLLERGERHHNSKLREEAIADIRYSYRHGERQHSIAKRHGISRATVSDIVRRRLWCHVA